MELLLAILAGAAGIWFVLRRRRSHAHADPAPKGQGASLPPDVDDYVPYNDFVADVVRQYRRTGRLSPRQAEAVRAAIDRIKEARSAQAYLGSVGDDVTVTGEIVAVDYEGKGKQRRGRYVIFTDRGPVIYDGLAVLVGRLGEVRFTATVRAHGISDAGHLETVVDNARDVTVLRKPSASYRPKGG